MRSLIGRLPPTSRRILLGVGLLAAIYVLGTVIELVRVAVHLQNGREQIEQLDLASVRRHGLDGLLDAAAVDFSKGHSIASSSPFLAAWRPIPVIGDQVDGFEQLTRAADELGSEAAATGETITAALDSAGASPAGRLLLMDVVLEELDRVSDVAAAIDLGDPDPLVGPVAGLHDSLERALERVPGELAPVEEQVKSIRALLDGPESYLIVAGNNAEMRSGAGMPLQVGTISFDRGDMTVSDLLAATTHLFAPHPTGEHNSNISDELKATYPNWLIGKDFPETAVVPDFPRTAPIYSDIAADAQGWETEGVVFIDAIALSNLLDVVGPITLGDVTYTAETAPQLILNQTYIDNPRTADRAERRSAQSDLAKAIFASIESSDFEILDLVSSLQDSAAGRHFMVWSRDPVLQDLVLSLGLGGDVHPLHTLVSLQNTSANKLDWYVRPEVDVQVDQDSRGWIVDMAVTVVHPEREVLASYIEGPAYNPFERGAHRALLTLQVPPAATDLHIVERPVTEFGFDGESKVIGTRFVTAKASSEVVHLGFRLPPEHSGMIVLPSARVAPVPWTVNGERYDDAVPFVVSFGEFDHPLGRGARLARVTAGLLGVIAVALALVALRRIRRSDGDVALAVVDLSTAAGLTMVAGLIALVAGAF